MVNHFSSFTSQCESWLFWPCWQSNPFKSFPLSKCKLKRKLKKGHGTVQILYRLHYFLHESVQSFTQYKICTAYPLSRHGELSRNFTKLRRRRRLQRQRQKAIGLVSKTTTLHVHHAFLWIPLPCTTTTWNDQILSFFWGRERQGDKLYHLCLNSGAAPPTSAPT